MSPEEKQTEMTREIQERLESDEWNHRLAASVLSQVKEENLELSRKRTLRAVIAGAAAALLLAVASYGTYDFLQPVTDDTAIGFLVDDDTNLLSAAEDGLDSVLDTVALFD